MKLNMLFWLLPLISLVSPGSQADSKPDFSPVVENYSSVLLDLNSDPVRFDQREIRSEVKNSYSSLSESYINGVVSVSSLEELGILMTNHNRWARMGLNLFQLTTVGSQMSFGQQALPPVQKGRVRQLQFDLHNMNVVRVVETSDDRVRVWAEGGVTWEHLLREASEQSGKKLVPFDTPSSDKISVAGALASNTFSRTSEFQEGFSSSHFHSFELMTPIKYLRCAPDSEDEAERECFELIPGAMGIAGVIVAVELDLKVIDPGTVVHTRVLEHASGAGNIAERFQALAAENRESKEWDQGFYAILHEERDGPYAIFMGSKTGRKTGVYKQPFMTYAIISGGDSAGHVECQLYEASEYDCTRGMEIYNHDLGQKSALIKLARSTTPYMINKQVKMYLGGFSPDIEFSLPDWVKKYKLFEGARFTNDFYDYTYYHNGYWEAHGGAVKEELPNMHQAWIMDAGSLEKFMTMVNGLLRENPEYKKYVLGNIILEDITPVPDNYRPMFPATGGKGVGINVVYQITVALDDGNDPELVSASTAFYEELSKRVKDYAPVYILKEAHVPDSILHEQYANGLLKVKSFCKRFDPYRLFSSALWERLLPESP